MVHVIVCVSALALLGSVALAGFYRPGGLALGRHLPWLTVFCLLQAVFEVGGAGLALPQTAVPWLGIAAAVTLFEFGRGAAADTFGRGAAWLRTRWMSGSLLALALLPVLFSQDAVQATDAAVVLLAFPGAVAGGLALRKAFSLPQQTDRVLAVTLCGAFIGYGVALAHGTGSADGFDRWVSSNPALGWLAGLQWSSVRAVCLTAAAASMTGLLIRRDLHALAAGGTSSLERDSEFARRLLDAAPIVVLVLSPEGYVVHANPALERLTGWPLDEIRGRDWFETFLPPDIRDTVRQHFLRIIAGHPPSDGVNVIQTRAGDPRLIEWHNQVLRDEGRTSGVLALGLDVTEQRRLAVQEATRLRRLELLAEMGLTLTGSPAAIIPQVVRMTATLFDVTAVVLAEPSGADLRFTLALVDGAFTDPLPPSRLAGSPCSTVVEDRTLRVYDHASERFPDAAFLQTYRATSYCGVPVTGAGGAVTGVLCLLDQRPRQYSDEDRHVLQIIGHRLSVEVERQAREQSRTHIEQELAQSEERLRRAQRIAGIGNWELDLRRGELWWSDEAFRLFGLSRESFRPSYEAFLALVHTDDRERVDSAYRQSLQDRTPYHITHRLVAPDGQRTFVEERCETEFAPDGAPLRSRGTVQDITARVETEAALRDSLLEKDTLLREVHHRVKNNLQIISTLLQFHAQRVRDPFDALAFSEARDRLRAMALVHETLYGAEALSRVDFSSYLYALVGELQRSYGQTHRALVHIAADEVALPVERAAPCGMIVCELLTNAFKHAFPDEESGDIMIELRSNHDTVTLVVRDTGVGIPAGLDPGTTTSFGWQLIRALSTQLGAVTTVDGTGGTTVTTSFPRAVAP